MKSIIFSLLFLISCSIVHYKIGAEEIEWTEEEKEFANNFFNYTVDLDKVQLYNAGKNDNNGANFAVGNNIFFNVEADYANHKEEMRGTLVHELVHVWQYQHYKTNEFLTDENKHDYHYTLTPFKPFIEYGAEEQAAMIQDYYKWIFLDEDSCMRAEDCKEIGLDWTIYLVEKHYNSIIDSELTD